MCRLAVIAFVWAWLFGMPAFAQDLFELEVFPAETTERGDTVLAFHANGIPGDVAPSGPQAIDHPFHFSVEVSHGWTDRFEVGIFLQTAPATRAQGERFAGGHVRPKFRVPRLPLIPLDVSLAAEYAINRSAFDENWQTPEIVPILERQDGRLTVRLNPEWTMTIKGPDAASLPKLGAAGKMAWRLDDSIAAGAEYYWKTGP